MLNTSSLWLSEFLYLFELQTDIMDKKETGCYDSWSTTIKGIISMIHTGTIIYHVDENEFVRKLQVYALTFQYQ